MEFVPKGRRIAAITAGTGAALLAIGGGWLWIERTPIASGYIDDALRQRNVPASYRIARIGFRTQRIEHIRIGDPADPDLVADWAEIRMSVGLGGVSVRAVDAGGVRLHGRIVDGQLSLGAIDRLLPTSGGGQAIALPDIALTARDMRLALDMPQGRIDARLDGAGGLAGGFRGRMRLASDRLALGGCIVGAPQATLTVAVDDHRPSLYGPVSAASLDCAKAGVRLTAPLLDVQAQSEDDLLHWKGEIVAQRGAVASTPVRIATIGGRMSFKASPALIKGGGSIFADGLQMRQGTAGRLAFDGEYRIDPRAGKVSAAGDVAIRRGAVDQALAVRSLQPLAGLGATPVGPVMAAWGDALRKAARGFDGQAALSIEASPAGGIARIERIDAHAGSGAALLVRGERAEGLALRWPGMGFVLNGSGQMDGGGLPAARISLRQLVPGAPLSGSAAIAPYRIGGASLSLDTVQFGAGPGGETAIRTRAVMSGPLADGRVDGLSLPISAALGRGGALAINRMCAPLRFDRLALAGTVLGATQLPLCPREGALFGRAATGRIYGGARIAGPRLRGRVGDQPLSMVARAIDVTVGKPGFAIDRLAVRLGDPVHPTRLDVARLDGGLDATGMNGRFADAAGKIGAVPLLISKGEGRWQLASSVLTLKAAVQVADAEQAAPRFLPLISDDVVLTLKGGRIVVNGMLREPTTHKAVSGMVIRHDLASGRGDAMLDVADLRFGKGFQPEAITPLTLGMIANVEGGVSGQGRIRWAGGNVTSDGLFRTDGLNLAAAFGPVTGIRGSLRFTDLLGLVSAPDQQVTLAEVNPGISVVDGIIHYRLLPEHKLSVSGGTWPFSGGTLTLDPTVLDMGQPVARRMTFRLANFDAATFVQQLDFKNISVTGKFDGVLPIIFDSQGGRIEGGYLKVRPGGGTLAYVGDVTNADLGQMARIAFDALKFMRYDKLTIDLNGDLDGEIVSRVHFDGTSDTAKTEKKSKGLVAKILAPITRRPFRFNIMITAPFRGLVNSAQTFIDPSIVLRQNMTTPVAAPPSPPVPIQPR